MTKSEALAKDTFTRFIVALFCTIVVNIVVLIVDHVSVWLWLCALLLIGGGMFFGYSQRDRKLRAGEKAMKPEVRGLVSVILSGIMFLVIVLTKFVLVSTNAPDGVGYAFMALIVASICWGQSAVEPAETKVSKS
jgi:Ca2+/Na+ antiporter